MTSNYLLAVYIAKMPLNNELRIKYENLSLEAQVFACKLQARYWQEIENPFDKCGFGAVIEFADMLENVDYICDETKQVIAYCFDAFFDSVDIDDIYELIDAHDKMCKAKAHFFKTFNKAHTTE